MSVMPKSRAKATQAANAAGAYATTLTVRLRRRMSAKDYKRMERAQVELARLWDAAVCNPRIARGPRTIGHVYTLTCKGASKHTSGTIRRKLAEDIVAAYKSYDVASKVNAKAQLPGKCVHGWRRARWDLYGATVESTSTKLRLNLGRNRWTTIDLSGDPQWARVRDRTLQLAVDRDANNELVLRVTCTPAPPAQHTPIQQRIAKLAPATAALDPGVRSWTTVVYTSDGGTRAHVIPAKILSTLRRERVFLKGASRAKADRRIRDAERKLAKYLHNLLRDEGVQHLVVGTVPCSGWARSSVLQRLYALCATDSISVTLVSETNSSRTCPKCDSKVVQTGIEYGPWCCTACGFSRTHSAGRDVVASTLLLRTRVPSAVVPRSSCTFVHPAPFNTPVIPSASQPPCGSAPGFHSSTQKPGKDTRIPSGVVGQRRHSKGLQCGGVMPHREWFTSVSPGNNPAGMFSPLHTSMGIWKRAL